MAPSAAGLKLCQCHKCNKYTTREPDTGTYVPGLLIKRKLWDTHQRDFALWQKQDREREEDSDPLVEAIINTTLRPAGLDDPLMAIRSGDRHPRTDIIEDLESDVAAGITTDAKQPGMSILY